MPSRARGLLISALVTLAIVSSVFAAGQSAAGGIQLADLCGASRANAPLFADLTLANGRAVWDHFPGFGISPILENMTGPVRVMAFKGRREGVPLLLQAGRTPPPLDNVVCVVGPDGDQWYFQDVPLDSFRP
jgi:hypothetical protein